ncbi:MAG: flagellar export chaperone FliS [Nitrospiria bacterium]
MSWIGARHDTTFPSWWMPSPAMDRCAEPSERAMLLLYTEALAHLKKARKMAARSFNIQSVIRILVELNASLAEREDREAVLNLAGLYRYMIHRLSTAAEPGLGAALIEVERLLQTLSDGWIQVIQTDDPEAPFPDSLESDDHRPPPFSFPAT